jgi:hypothetical protein
MLNDHAVTLFLTYAFPLCSPPFSFLPGPSINILSIEPEEISHVRVWKWKLVCRSLGPLQYSGSSRLIFFVVELPILG